MECPNRSLFDPPNSSCSVFEDVRTGQGGDTTNATGAERCPLMMMMMMTMTDNQSKTVLTGVFFVSIIAITICMRITSFIRISLTLYLMSCMTNLVSEDGTDPSTSQPPPSSSSCPLNWLWFVVFRSGFLRLAFYITCPVSLIAFCFKTEKLNIIKDMSDVGFDHLVEMSNTTDRKSPKELVSEALRGRDPGNIPPVFPNGWIPIVESTNVDVGKCLSVSALGRQFAVFRGQEGQVHVLDAFCPHLGANLAVGGKVEGNCLKCPFHGWKFDGETGKCLFIPYAKRVPEVAKTKSWLCCEENGFIFLWHHAEGSAPSWEVPRIDEIARKNWVYKGRTEHVVRCHIQEIPENGADVFHLHELHSPSIFSDKKFFNRKFDWRFMKHDWRPNWESCLDEGFGHTAKVTLSQHVTISDFKVPLTGFNIDIRQIGPAMVHLHFKTAFGRAVFLQNIIPEGPLRQRIVHLLYGETRFFQPIANILLRGEAIMLERDIMIWNNKKFMSNPVLVKEDRLISRYRRWYSQFYSENSPTLRDVQDRSLDW